MPKHERQPYNCKCKFRILSPLGCFLLFTKLKRMKCCTLDHTPFGNLCPCVHTCLLVSTFFWLAYWQQWQCVCCSLQLPESKGTRLHSSLYFGVFDIHFNHVQLLLMFWHVAPYIMPWFIIRNIFGSPLVQRVWDVHPFRAHGYVLTLFRSVWYPLWPGG